MEKKPPLMMTPFDMMVTNEAIQMMKLMLPYMPPGFQRMAGMYAKFSELQNAIYYFQPPYYHSRRGRLRQKELSLNSMLQDLGPYLPEDASGTMDMISQVMSMMEIMNAAGDGSAGGGFPGGGMDFTEMAKQMLTPEQQSMFDMMDAFQSERTDSNERMDEQSGNEESGPCEAGADQSGRSADEGEEREISGSGYDEPDHECE